jgi:hypothetical protein
MHALKLITPRPAAAFALALAAIGLLVALAVPNAADSAAEKKRLMPVLKAYADVGVPPPDRTLEKYGIIRPFRPKVAFRLKRAYPGATYHLDLKRRTPFDFSGGTPGVIACGVQTVSTITTKPPKANSRGEVGFPLLPAGGYLDIRELCPGHYIGVLEEKLPGSRYHKKLLTVGFFYPEMDVFTSWWKP